MGYNKPITARIQHSTNKGMKVQEPLLDIGSAAKKKELNYGADTSLTSGVENSQFVDIAKPVKEAIDKPKAAAKQTKGQTDTFGPGGTNPNPKLYAGIVANSKTPAKQTVNTDNSVETAKTLTYTHPKTKKKVKMDKRSPEYKHLKNKDKTISTRNQNG